MPNANAPTGLTPRRYRNGAPWNGVARTYFVPATDATPLFVGDPVVINGNGDSMGTPSVTRATAGASNRITGVVVGFRPTAPFQSNYRAASTASYVLVADDPELLFEVQEGTGTALTSDALGQNFNLAAGAGGNTAVGTSSFYMDNTSGTTAATGQLRLIAIQSRADNTIGQYAKWLVAINQTTETGAAGSLGV